jgi:DNA-binding LacI/PurR family transcriptional regulator
MEALCEQLSPGDVIPRYPELMRRYNASERSVLWALDELRRRGKILRRHGARTVVAPRGGERPPASTAMSRSIVAIARPDRSIFDQAMSQLCDLTEEAELSLVCRFIHGEVPSIEEFTERPLGYIVFRRDLLPLARELQAAGNRVVTLGIPGQGEIPGVPNVHGDHETGGYLATKHLLDLGHGHLAAYSDSDIQNTARGRGYERALNQARKAGQTVQLSYMDQTTADPEAIRHYLTGPDAPTGILCWNDREAIRLLGLLHKAGIRVPEDVSLTGYDDLPEGHVLHPTLTSVNTAIERQLQTAVELLTRAEPVNSNHSVIVMPTLIARESTAAPSR